VLADLVAFVHSSEKLESLLALRRPMRSIYGGMSWRHGCVLEYRDMVVGFFSGGGS
jgi:hypothetical protein